MGLRPSYLTRIAVPRFPLPRYKRTASSLSPTTKQGKFHRGKPRVGGLRISVELTAMEVLRVQFFAMAILALALALVVPSINAQSLASAPAPAPAPTSDGMAVDQGIAYVLMLLALVLTYIIH